MFNGSSASLQDTISLFQRARVVLGPHGAGLSHILFSAPGTTGEGSTGAGHCCVPADAGLCCWQRGGHCSSRPPARLTAGRQDARVAYSYVLLVSRAAACSSPSCPPHPSPSSAVIEFLFLADPPLMFWHAAGALGQPYWLLPVPQAYWMQEEMQVRPSALVGGLMQ